MAVEGAFGISQAEGVPAWTVIVCPPASAFGPWTKVIRAVQTIHKCLQHHAATGQHHAITKQDVRCSVGATVRVRQLTLSKFASASLLGSPVF